MADLRRISGVACLLLVVLRLSIGWHLLYEGLWKIDTLDTATPWSAEPYLKNAQGPFRGQFREMTGDPDEFGWLDYDTVAARWDAWKQSFLAHHPDLTDEQKSALDAMIDGVESISEPLARLPEGYKLPSSLTREIDYWGRKRRVLTFQADKQRLVLDGKLLLLPSERNALLRGVPEIAEPTEEQAEEARVRQQFRRAVERLYVRGQRLARDTFKIRLRASLLGDPDRAGQYLASQKGTIDENRPGDIDRYKKIVQQYEEYQAAADQDFEFDHARQMWTDLNDLRSQLVGPVKALDAELKKKANYELPGLTEAQRARGVAPEPERPIDRIDKMTIAGLTILGGLLIVGLATRLSAVAAAVMLFSFYLAMPPWPGVPPLPGPEHSFIVNKNLIEVIALLAIAALPTGTWFGLDAVFHKLFFGRKSATAAPQNDSK